MAKEIKVTKKEMFARVIEVIGATAEADKDAMLDFLNHEVALLNKKSSSNGENKNAAVNNAICEMILTVLADSIDTPMTAGEIMADVRLRTYIDKDGKTVTMSSQKLTSCLTKLKKAEKIVRTEVKKKAYYSLT